MRLSAKKCFNCVIASFVVLIIVQFVLLDSSHPVVSGYQSSDHQLQLLGTNSSRTNRTNTLLYEKAARTSITKKLINLLNSLRLQRTLANDDRPTTLVIGEVVDSDALSGVDRQDDSRNVSVAVRLGPAENATTRILNLSSISASDLKSSKFTAALTKSSNITTTRKRIAYSNIIPSNATAKSVKCELKFANDAENKRIVELAKLGDPREADVFNTRALLHSYWNVPDNAAALRSPTSPVSFDQPALGGYWTPPCVPACTRPSPQKPAANVSGTSDSHTSPCGVTILVPYRARPDNLDVFLAWMHTFLQSQRRQYRIVVVEQVDKLKFNRAKLFNVAITELLKQNLSPLSCFALHDVDKVPEDTRNVYECADRPRHMMHLHRRANDSTRRYTSGRHYSSYIGGVLLLPRDVWTRINGLSNRYFGWGREDDDLNARLRLSKITVEYTGSESGKYLILDHPDDHIDNDMPWPSDNLVRRLMGKDGINSLVYKAETTLEPLYTHIMVEL